MVVSATLGLLVVGLVPYTSAGSATDASSVVRKGGLVRIEGPATDTNAGVSVAGAGDVNGDGRPDVLVGAHFAGKPPRGRAGSAYVLFSKDRPGTVDLAALGRAGFRIDGAAAQDLSGWSVAAAGDVNGDGRADVIIGAPQADNNARPNSGSAYVVLGRDESIAVDLAALGRGGFRIDGASAGDEAGTSVAGAGDLNADGLADVIVGARFAGNNGRAYSGSAYVVFGRPAPGTVDLAGLGQAGFRIDGAAAEDLAGWSVARAGDVNGDGRGDVLVGARFAGRNVRVASGSAYVVFGTDARSSVDLAVLGRGGFSIDGAAAGDLTGGSVAAAGDLNRDGLADVLVGARGADNNRRAGSGSAYVIFGAEAPRNIDLSALGQSGFRIDGARTGDRAAYSVAGAGDVNGDGRGDVLVGAHFADNDAREDSGSVYVVFGRNRPANVDLAALGRAGLRIDGAAAGDGAGWSVAAAGDLDGDLLADVLVGAPDADDNARKGSGSAYVVFGRSSHGTVHLDTRAPALALRARTPQRALAQRRVVLRASCNEACALSASGRIVVVGQGTSLPLRPASGRLARPGRLTLRLALSTAATRRLVRVVERGLRLVARVSVRARDRAGNASTATRTVALRN